MSALKAFFIILVSIFTASLAQGQVLDVFRLAKPTASGFNLLVSAVRYEGQGHRRRSFYLAKEENGRIVEEGSSSDSEIESGFYTKENEFHDEFLVYEDKDGKTVKETRSGKPLVASGNFVSIYQTNIDKVLRRPTARVKMISWRNGERGYLWGFLSGEKVPRVSIESVEGLIFPETNAATVFRFEDSSARLSFFADGSKAGDTLVVFRGEPVTTSVVYERGTYFENSKQKFLGYDTRLVLGNMTENGIRPVSVARGIVVGDIFYLKTKDSFRIHDPANSVLQIDLKRRKLIVGQDQETSLVEIVAKRNIPQDSIYQFEATESGYAQALGNYDIPQLLVGEDCQSAFHH